MTTAVVREVNVTVWPSGKRLGEWNVSMVGRHTVEHATVKAATENAAMAAASEMVK